MTEMDTTSAERMLNLLRRMEKMPLRAPIVDNTHLTLPQVFLLLWVDRHPGCSINQIAEGMDVTPPTVSVAIRKLVADDWLRREADLGDRRVQHIYLTDHAEKILRRMHIQRKEAISRFLNGLDARDQDQLLDLLELAVSKFEISLHPGSN